MKDPCQGNLFQSTLNQTNSLFDHPEKSTIYNGDNVIYMLYSKGRREWVEGRVSLKVPHINDLHPCERP